MSPLGVVLILVLLLCVFGVPQVGGYFGYDHGYGYFPSGLLGVVLVVLLVLFLAGRFR